MTHDFTDEQLRAFLDGTIDDRLADAIEAAINADAALAQRVEGLVVADDTADQVRDAFAPLLAAPVPERLSGVVAPPPAGATLLDFAEARARKNRRIAANDDGMSATGGGWRWPQWTAMAASLALGVLVGGPLLDGLDGTSRGDALVVAGAGGLTVPQPVAAMLDTAPGGRQVALDGLGRGEVVLTFRNADGQLCRQFTLAEASGTSDALACAADTGWQVEALGRRAAPTGEMRLAGGDAAVGVVAAVDAMIAGEALVGDAEQAVLRQR